MSGDKIIKINDTIVAGIKITNKQVIGKLRGEKGTKVKVSIARNHNEELLDFNIMRDKIPIFSVDVGYRVDKQTGYIKINRFSANTYSEFTHELEELKNQGMENLIIDLRQNPGGYLNAATMIADELLAGQKLLVYTEGKAYERKDYKSRGGGLFEKGDLVVLIDEGSASASEILAGAIQDLDRGTVIGRRSFGKGLVQEQYKLQDGSALRLTVARYYTPSGRSIQKPYDQGNEKYYSEIAARYYDGEFTSEDSITFADSLQYFTSKGKSVYGGGGIMPDIFIAMDTSLHFQRLIRVRGYVPEFIYDFYSKTQDYFTRYSDFDDFNEHFAIADTVFEGFADYAITAGSKFKRADFEDVKPEINVFLKAYLGRQMWKNEGFYPIFNTIDSTYLKGVEIVTSPTSVQ